MSTFSHMSLLQARCIDKTDPDKTGKVTQSTSVPCRWLLEVVGTLEGSRPCRDALADATASALA